MADKHSPKYRRKKKPSGSAAIVTGLVAVMAVLVLFSLGLRLLLGTPQVEQTAQSAWI